MSDIQAVAETIEPFVEDSMERSNEIIAGLWKRGYRIVERPPKIDVNFWKDERSPEGYMILERRKTVGEVWAELVAIVGNNGPGHDEYLSCNLHVDTELPWPEGEIVCFAMNGSSEGDYVHVEVHHGERRMLVFLAKTFDGRDAAWAFARQLADIFEELA